MLIKETNLYINEANIVTIKPYVSNNAFGLSINGVDYKLGEMFNADKDLQKAKLAKMKSYCTQIVKRIENK